MEKNPQIGTLSTVALMLLMSMGADVVAPKPVKEPKLKALGLTENSHFDGVDEDLKQVEDRDEKLAIIKGAIINHLTPSQMITLHEFCHSMVNAIMDCCHENPEYRQELEADEALKRIIGNKKGSDWDINVEAKA